QVVAELGRSVEHAVPVGGVGDPRVAGGHRAARAGAGGGAGPAQLVRRVVAVDGVAGVGATEHGLAGEVARPLVGVGLPGGVGPRPTGPPVVADLGEPG